MPIHSIPVLPFIQPRSIRPKFTLPIHTRKRKHSPSPSGSSDEDEPAVSLGLPAASTNPHSLGPDEIKQYRVAGLELDQPLPDVKGFPHRGFPRDDASEGVRRAPKPRGKGKQKAKEDAEDDELHTEKIRARREAKKKPTKSKPPLKAQHLSVLIAILHRCMREGDIPRAMRAYGLLLRTQVSHHLIDFRGSGYWAIGAELLLRSGDAAPDAERGSDVPDCGSDHSADSDTHKLDMGARVRWGTTEGLAKMNAYLEKLILEYPANVRAGRPGNITALDLWPVLIAWEIYGVQYEQKEALRKIDLLAEGGEEERGGSDSPKADDDMHSRSALQRQQERAENLWQKREDVRTKTLADAEQIATRLDELLITPSYMSDKNLLRLAGMMALYVGDLSIPALMWDVLDADEGEYVDEKVERRWKRLRHDREADHQRGRKKQDLERLKAKRYFEQMERAAEQTQKASKAKSKRGLEKEMDNSAENVPRRRTRDEESSEDQQLSGDLDEDKQDQEELFEREPSLSPVESYELNEPDDDSDADARYRREIEDAG